MNNQSYVWEIRIRKRGNDQPWDNIEKEPATPYYSLLVISRLCHGLLFEDSNIISIKIIDRDTHKQEYVFNQKV